MAQVAELDHGILHTFVDLVRAPGPMIRGYFAGRRRKYTSPLTFVLLSTGLSLLRSSLNPREREYVDHVLKSDPVVMDLFGKPRYEMFMQIQQFVTSNKFVFDALLLIPVALAIRFLFRKKNLNLAEASVFTAYALGAATFLSILITLPWHLMGNEQDAGRVSVLISVAYVLYAGSGVFGKSVGTAFRLLVAYAVGLLAMTWGTAAIPFILIHHK